MKSKKQNPKAPFLFTLASILTAAASHLVLVPTAEAGGNGSHGGNAVVCFDDPAIVRDILATNPIEKPNPLSGWLGRSRTIKKGIPNSALSRITLVRMLDLYAAPKAGSSLDHLQSTRPEFFEPFPGENNSDYVERLARRLEGRTPGIARILRTGFEALDKNVTVYDRDENGLSGIEQVTDYGPFRFKIDSESCLIATLAWQDSKGKLQIDGRLYHHEKHSELSKKTMIVHEIFYWNSLQYARSLQVNPISRANPIYEFTGYLLQQKISREALLAFYQKTLPRPSWSDDLRAETLGLPQAIEPIIQFYTKKTGAVMSLQEIEAQFEKERAAGEEITFTRRRTGLITTTEEKITQFNTDEKISHLRLQLEKTRSKRKRKSITQEIHSIERIVQAAEDKAEEAKKRRLSTLSEFESLVKNLENEINASLSRNGCDQRVDEAKLRKRSLKPLKPDPSYSTGEPVWIQSPLEFLESLITEKAIPFCDSIL